MLNNYLTINLFYGNLLINVIKWSQDAQKYFTEKVFDFFYKQTR